MEKITYNLRLKNGKEYVFEVDIERPDCAEKAGAEAHAFWTKLNYRRCSNCLLQASNCEYCPAALDIEEIAMKFEDCISFERVDVWVHTRERSFFKDCDMQEALKSLFGLILATGRCPILSKLKPLAYFHLPFAGLDETVYRVVGIYLIKQYLMYHGGSPDPDWSLKGIEELYKQLETVNTHLMNRLRDASNKDATCNALYILITLTNLVAIDVNQILDAIGPIIRKGF